MGFDGGAVQRGRVGDPIDWPARMRHSFKQAGLLPLAEQSPIPGPNCRSQRRDRGHQKPRYPRNFRPAGCRQRGHGRRLSREADQVPFNELTGPVGPLRITDSLPPAVRIRKSPLCCQSPAKSRRGAPWRRFGAPGFLPDFSPSVREERGWASAFGRIVRRMSVETLRCSRTALGAREATTGLRTRGVSAKCRPNRSAAESNSQLPAARLRELGMSQRMTGWLTRH